MKITIFDIEMDFVINGIVANGCMSYNEALQVLVPLINKTDFDYEIIETIGYTQATYDYLVEITLQFK